MFNFREKFKTSDSVDLLKMLEHPEKFQPDAITAAKEILEERKNAHPEKWQLAIDQLEYEKELNIRKTTKPTVVALHNDEDIHNIWIEDDVNIKNQKKAWDQILVICVVLAILIIKDSYFTLSNFLGETRPKDLNTGFGILYILVGVVLPIVSIIFLLKKEKTGWILLLTQCIYLSLSQIIMFGYFAWLLFSIGFVPPLTIYSLIPFVIYLVIFRRAVSPKIMNLYNVNKKELWLTVTIVSFLYICFVIGQQIDRT